MQPSEALVRHVYKSKPRGGDELGPGPVQEPACTDRKLCSTPDILDSRKLLVYWQGTPHQKIRKERLKTLSVKLEPTCCTAVHLGSGSTDRIGMQVACHQTMSSAALWPTLESVVAGLSCLLWQ